MEECKKLAKKAIASLITVAITATATTTPTPSTDNPKKDWVKCYGVAAANKNDCATPLAACPGTVAEPGACYAWIYAPKEICEKLNKASVDKPAADCKVPMVPGT